MNKRLDFDQKAYEEGTDLNSYYCVIPWKVLSCTDLPPMAKLIYGEISSLCNREGFCWAANQHFADVFTISRTSVSKHISMLEFLGFIEIESEQGGNVRKIYIVSPLKKTLIPLKENLKGTLKENLNIDTHTIDIQKDNIYKELLSFFKEKIYNCRLTDAAKDKIRTRLKTFTKEQLLQAIENFSKDSWWMEHNSRKGMAWFFKSDDRIEQFINMIPKRSREVIVYK